MNYIRITKSISGCQFPYGHLSEGNIEFIKAAVGMVLPAEHAGMNYYKLPNKMLVHIYNAVDVPAPAKEVAESTVQMVFENEMQALRTTHEVQLKKLQDATNKLNAEYFAALDDLLARKIATLDKL